VEDACEASENQSAELKIMNEKLKIKVKKLSFKPRMIERGT